MGILAHLTPPTGRCHPLLPPSLSFVLALGRQVVTEPAESRLAGVDSDQPTVSAPESVTVVLPCLNEEKSVGLVVEEALSTLKAAGIPGEVLVVDNGSI